MQEKDQDWRDRLRLRKYIINVFKSQDPRLRSAYCQDEDMTCYLALTDQEKIPKVNVRHLNKKNQDEDMTSNGQGRTLRRQDIQWIRNTLTGPRLIPRRYPKMDMEWPRLDYGWPLKATLGF